MAMINNNLVGSHWSDSEEENIAYPCPLPFPPKLERTKILIVHFYWAKTLANNMLLAIYLVIPILIKIC